MWPISDSQKSKIVPVVTLIIIVVNVAIYAYQLFIGDITEILRQFALIPSEIANDSSAWYTLFSSMFLHASLIHLFSNMWYLWVFGDNVEAKMGSARFLIFYLAAGIFAAGVQLLLVWNSEVAIVGASGAISGVLGYYAVAFPGSRIKSFIVAYPRVGIYHIRAPYLLVVWFAIQFISTILSFSGDDGGVAWGAHVGGFLFGAVIAWLGIMMSGEKRVVGIEKGGRGVKTVA